MKANRKRRAYKQVMMKANVDAISLLLLGKGWGPPSSEKKNPPERSFNLSWFGGVWPPPTFP
eukprot:626123-Amphidinium_carterae.1